MGIRSRAARWGRTTVALAVAITGLTALSTTPAQAAGPVVVSLTFDDGLAAQHQAASILRGHGIRATYYVNSGAIDQRGGGGTMTWTQVRELAAAGHEIGGHTRDHVDITTPTLTDEDRWQQLCADRIRLVEEGFAAHSFAYATGNNDDRAVGILRGCGYQTARTAGGLQYGSPAAADTRPPMDGAYRVRALGDVGSDPITLTELQEGVENAHTGDGGWLPILFHRVCYAADPSYTNCMASYRPIDAVTLENFVAWLTAPGQVGRGISTATMSEAFNRGRTVPTVRIGAPVDGSVSADPPTLSGTTTLAGAVAVKVFEGDYATGTPVATLEDTAAGGTWSVDTPATLAPGRYTALASVTADGVTGTSVPVRFDVGTPGDTTAPAVRITTPADGATLNVRAPEISGTAGQAPGDQPNATVVVEGSPAAGAPISRSIVASVGPGGAWSITPSLADGTYTARARQSDSTGNVGESTIVRFTVDTTTPADTTAPAVHITAPANGSRITDTQPRFSGTAGTATTDVKTVTVRVHNGTTPTGPVVQTLEAAVPANGSWSVAPSAELGPGDYTAVAEQSDQAGNTGKSAPVTFTVQPRDPGDTTAPTVSISEPTNGATLPSTPQVRGRAGTADGDSAAVTVRVHVGSSASGTPAEIIQAAVGAGGAWVASPETLPDGTYTVVAMQRDTAGNEGTSNAVTFTLESGDGVTVASASPIALPQGATNLSVAVRGTGFAAGTRVAVTGGGVSVRSTEVVNPRVLQLRVDVAQGSRLGQRSLVVTSAGGSVECTGCFRVTRGPSIRAMSSGKVGQGARHAVVRLVGSFGPGARVGVSGQGVRTQVLSRDARVLRVAFWVRPAAPLGGRTLTVTNGDGGTFTCAGCLKVVKAPQAHRVYPATVLRGRSTWVRVHGTAFSRATAIAVTGPGVRVTAVRMISGKRLRVRVYVAPRARRTARSLVLVDRGTRGRSVLRRAIRIR